MLPHDTIPRLCSMLDCNKNVLARGWCAMHYARWRFYGDPTFTMRPFTTPLAERFWQKVNKDGPVPSHMPHLGNCWVWTAGCRAGYGMIQINHKSTEAHRVGYELQNGPIPEGLDVLHKCDNPPCVRGDHLRVGTHMDNVLDMIAKGRLRPGITHGTQQPNAKLTEAIIPEIRERWANGTITQKALSQYYGIHQSTISRILSGKRWSHI